MEAVNGHTFFQSVCRQRLYQLAQNVWLFLKISKLMAYKDINHDRQLTQCSFIIFSEFHLIFLFMVAVLSAHLIIIPLFSLTAFKHHHWPTTIPVSEQSLNVSQCLDLFYLTCLSYLNPVILRDKLFGLFPPKSQNQTYF